MDTQDVWAILASSPDGVFGVDLNQRVCLWNRAAQHVLGWTAKEAIGRRCYEVLGGLDLREPRDAALCIQNCLVIQWARGGRIAPAQRVWVVAKNAERKMLSITHVLVPAQRKEATCLVHIFHETGRQGGDVSQLNELASAMDTIAPSPCPQYDGDGFPVEKLTAREREVLCHLAEGLGTAEVAERLVVSVPTVRNHICSTLNKLGVHTRLAAVAAASRRGLI